MCMKASLETKDPLYQDKRILVQKQKLSSIQTFQVIFDVALTWPDAMLGCSKSNEPLLTEGLCQHKSILNV